MSTGKAELVPSSWIRILMKLRSITELLVLSPKQHSEHKKFLGGDPFTIAGIDCIIIFDLFLKKDEIIY